MRTLFLAILLGVSSTFAVACAGEDHHANSPEIAKLPLTAPGDAKVGDKTMCPVSGEEFVVTATSPKVEFEGKTYYTCCPNCAKKLQADPKSFIEKLAKPAGT